MWVRRINEHIAHFYFLRGDWFLLAAFRRQGSAAAAFEVDGGCRREEELDYSTAAGGAEEAWDEVSCTA